MGSYTLKRLIGRGGMAEVYLALAEEGPEKGHHVAIKRVLPEHASKPEVIRRFMAEAELAQLASHPSLVSLIEVGFFRDHPYLVLEYVDGCDLSHIIEQCRSRGISLPLPFCTHIAARTLEALHVLHETRDVMGNPLGIVHCDVSPGNVFISNLGVIKVGDLGVARSGLTEANLSEIMGGKLSYLAPEQARGEKVDRRADLFAAAAVLFELLTSRLPYKFKSLKDVASAGLFTRPLDPRKLRKEIPGGLVDVIRKALGLKPDSRYSSAEEMLEALTPYRDEMIGTDLAIASVVRGLFPKDG